MILSNLIKATYLSLQSDGVEEATLEAELLVMKAMGLDRPHLYSLQEICPTAMQMAILTEDLRRRLGGEPWPYICGYKEFYGLNISVSNGVFIPRPESELLVDLVLERVARIHRGTSLNIAEIGTGSGAIAVALAVHIPQAVIYATDTSQLALNMAKLNSENHNVQERVMLLEGDLLSPVYAEIDIVVSNPPYVSSGALATLAKEVRSEPVGALDGGEDGMDVIRRLIPQAIAKLRRSGDIIIEISPEQSTEIEELCQVVAPVANYAVHKDLSGRQRAVLISL